ncbi:hypothetical protein [Mesorhizobium sp.]|uniref:hypothetical protein n=1 Tax=Mesorhizobium sp. TaxID=1871066 RepID=UPI0025BE845E|nr:hypothetical protein [Mesorhizobium sp.]
MSDVLCLGLQEASQELLRIVGRMPVSRQPLNQAALAGNQRFAFKDVALCHLQ